MNATYKSRFNEEQIKLLCSVFLKDKFVNLKVRDQVIEDILDTLEVNNLDNSVLSKIIIKWNEKVK